MVLSKMYCSEQIVIPEKISNLLKTYAKAALKTQPYDLLRWSAAYFRCLSLDDSPPVKPRYEHENVFGSLTKGYLKVLLSQVGKGFFVRRDILEHRWNGLCLPEDELLNFLSLTRMLYWPQVHWLKLMVVMVGSINHNFYETVNMLCELLTDEPEGGSSPVPLWLFRECFMYISELDCSEEQTFFDGKKILCDGVLESETRIPNIPRKLSSISFKNAVIDYWKYRIENAEKEASEHGDAYPDEMTGAASKAQVDFSNVRTLSQTKSIKDGSNFRITGEFKDPQEVIKRSTEFESVIVMLQQLECDGEFNQECHVIEKERTRIAQRDIEFKEILEKMSQMTEENAQHFLTQQCCNLLQDIGPPWNWLYNFASQTCYEKSYNFLESVQSDVTKNINEQMSPDESFDYLNEKFISTEASVVTTVDDSKCSESGAPDASFSLYNVDENNDRASNHHKLLINTICSISDASEKDECNIKECASIISFLEEQHLKQKLEVTDYQRLIQFIERAQERQIVFNDLNALYNYFIQESSRERSTHEAEIREEQVYEEEDDEAKMENLIASNDKTHTEKVENSERAESKNVVSIFGESGIEVDGKLLEAKVSERMILGLVDKPQFEDNVSDVASSVSSLSQAETIKMKQNVTQEKDTQTVSYKEQIHSKRVQSKPVGKSKSASSIKRQPFTCKIPAIPGIGPTMKKEKLDKIIRFIAHRSFQQGGFIYPRNFLEEECPSMM